MGSQLHTGIDYLQEVPTVRFWLGNLWCFGWVVALRDCIMIIQEIKIKFHNFRIEKLNIKKLTRGNQPSVLGQPSLVQSYLQVQYT